MKKQKDVIDFENSIGAWLGRTVKMTDYFLQEAFQSRNIDVNKEQMIVLKKLHDRDGINQNELASLTYRDKSSMARLLSKMESKNYVIRRQCATDKRSNKVFLTVQGRDVFKELIPVVKNVSLIIENGIGYLEKQMLIKTMKKVQLNFKKTNDL